MKFIKNQEGFVSVDGGTEDTIITRLKFGIFVIV